MRGGERQPCSMIAGGGGLRGGQGRQLRLPTRSTCNRLMAHLSVEMVALFFAPQGSAQGR